ncbi:hypothetical protein J6590_005755 [Homalodisca vitripennis]|nr:hypothetical protein J6590_005755 [Homalodisca vitripennis]
MYKRLSAELSRKVTRPRRQDDTVTLMMAQTFQATFIFHGKICGNAWLSLANTLSDNSDRAS